MSGNLEKLPCDILLEILKKADHESYINMALTSKKIHSCLEHGKFDIEEQEKIMGVLTDRIKAKIRGKGPLKNKLKELKGLVREEEKFRAYLDAGMIPSEKLQIAAVNRNAKNIISLFEKGIIPSEKVQIACVHNSDDPNAIQFIIQQGIVPSEEVQIASVLWNPDSIGDIINGGIIPSKKVIFAAFSSEWEYGGEDHSNALEYIISLGTPTEEMQLAAVRNNPKSIRFLFEAGIVPSHEVQMAALSNDFSWGEARSVIHYMLEAGIIPTEDMQIVGVFRNEWAIDDLRRAKIIPSEKVQKADHEGREREERARNELRAGRE